MAYRFKRQHYALAAVLYDVKLNLEKGVKDYPTTALIDESWFVDAEEPKEQLLSTRYGEDTAFQVYIRNRLSDKYPELRDYLLSWGSYYTLTDPDQIDSGSITPDAAFHKGLQITFGERVRVVCALHNGGTRLAVRVGVLNEGTLQHARLSAESRNVPLGVALSSYVGDEAFSLKYWTTLEPDEQRRIHLPRMREVRVNDATFCTDKEVRVATMTLLKALCNYALTVRSTNELVKRERQEIANLPLLDNSEVDEESSSTPQ